MARGIDVLIVEDNLDILEAVQELLVDSGYAVATARNGQEALDFLRNFDPPCVVLLDMNMPVMSGREFMKIKNKEDSSPKLPVVVITANPDQAYGLGAQKILRKPPDIDALLLAVATYCGSAAESKSAA